MSATKTQNKTKGPRPKLGQPTQAIPLRDDEKFVDMILRFYNSLENDQANASSQLNFLQETQKYTSLPDQSSSNVVDSFLAAFVQIMTINNEYKVTVKAIEILFGYLKHDPQIYQRFKPNKLILKKMKLEEFINSSNQKDQELALDFSAFLLRYHRDLDYSDLTDDNRVAQLIKRAEVYRCWADIEDLCNGFEESQVAFHEHKQTAAHAFQELFKHIESTRNASKGENQESLNKISELNSDIMQLKEAIKEIIERENNRESTLKQELKGELTKLVNGRINDIEFSITNSVLKRIEKLEIDFDFQQKNQGKLQNDLTSEEKRKMQIEDTMKEHLDIIQTLNDKLNASKIENIDELDKIYKRIKEIENGSMAGFGTTGVAQQTYFKRKDQAPIDHNGAAKQDFDPETGMSVGGDKGGINGTGIPYYPPPNQVTFKELEKTVENLSNEFFEIKGQLHGYRELSTQELKRLENTIKTIGQDYTVSNQLNMEKLETLSEKIRKGNVQAEVQAENEAKMQVKGPGSLQNVEAVRLMERIRYLETDLIEIKNERKKAIISKVNYTGDGQVQTRDLDKIIEEINSVWSYVQRFVDEHVIEKNKIIENVESSTEQKLETFDWMIRFTEFLSPESINSFLLSFKTTVTDNPQNRSNYARDNHQSKAIVTAIQVLDHTRRLERDNEVDAKLAIILSLLEPLLINEANLKRAMQLEVIDLLIDVLREPVDEIHGTPPTIKFCIRCMTLCMRQEIAILKFLHNSRSLFKMQQTMQFVMDEEILANSIKIIRLCTRDKPNLLNFSHNEYAENLISLLYQAFTNRPHSEIIAFEGLGALKNIYSRIENAKLTQGLVLKVLIDMATTKKNPKIRTQAAEVIGIISKDMDYAEIIIKMGGKDFLSN